jgi:twinkle protein
MSDSASLNRLMLDQFEQVLMHLLPKGKRKGNVWAVGGPDGSEGESMQITMSGPSAGRFCDWANKDVKGATPLWLWATVRNIKFQEAIKEAKEFLGVRDDDYGIRRHKARSFAKPGAQNIKIVESNTPVMDYLTIERRLDPVVLTKAKVCESEDGAAVVFPFIERDQEAGKDVCVHRKFLKLERPDGKKETWTTKGTKRCLYGKNLIDENFSDLVICEGEIDALSWNSVGIPAVSIPNGVSDFDWVDVDWEWLSRFERINVSMDMDEHGEQAAPEVCKRLGLHRCYIVSLPKKDANECLVSGLKTEDFQKLIASAKPIELDEIKRPDDFRKEVADYYECDPASRGWDTPWTPTVPWRVRKSEFTILSGFSGHGKTAGLNQLMLHLISQGCKIMDASLEIKPGMTLYNMTRCAIGQKYSDKEDVEACISWLNESLFFLDCIGTVSVDRLMHAMEYARKRHGIDIFVIDSLFKCGLSSEDYGSQRQFADKLTTFCNNTGAHVILVAHSRKMSNGNEHSIPSKSDVAGSSDLTNAAFNVIIFWRNKMKKHKMDDARQANDAEELVKWMDQPDGKIVLDKQRFGEGEESQGFVWFCPESFQFHTVPNKKLPYFVKKELTLP